MVDRQTRELRIISLLFIWGFLLAWYLRVAPSLGDPGMIGGYGVHRDWARQNILKTGRLFKSVEGHTEASAHMSYETDLSATFLAILSMIVGEVQLQERLKFLLTFPNFFFFLPGIVGIAFYNTIPEKGSLSDIATLTWLGLLVSPVFMNYTRLSINPNGYAIGIYAILLYLSYRISRDASQKRLLAVFTLLVPIMVSLKHTQGLLATLIIPGYFFLDHLEKRLWRPSESRINKGTASHSLIIMLAAGSIMYVVGTHYSTVVNEIVWNVTGMFLIPDSAENIFYAAQSSEFRSSLQFGFDLESLSKISKIIVRVLYVALLLKFVHNLLKLRFRWKSHHERFISLLLLLYPLVLFMFYSYGGIGVGVQRTAAAGAPVIILVCACVLKTSNGKHSNRSVFVVLAIIGVIMFTITAQAPQLVDEERRYTNAEIGAIEFAGENIDQSQNIFSTPKMGTPLLYYNHQRLVYVRVVHEGWEERLREIYFGDESKGVRKEIAETIRIQTLSENKNPNEHYIIASKKIATKGIPLNSLIYKSPENDFNEKYDKGYNRVYDSGDGLIYKTVPT